MPGAKLFHLEGGKFRRRKAIKQVVMMPSLNYQSSIFIPSWDYQVWRLENKSLVSKKKKKETKSRASIR